MDGRTGRGSTAKERMPPAGLDQRERKFASSLTFAKALSSRSFSSQFYSSSGTPPLTAATIRSCTRFSEESRRLTSGRNAVDRSLIPDLLGKLFFSLSLSLIFSAFENGWVLSILPIGGTESGHGWKEIESTNSLRRYHRSSSVPSHLMKTDQSHQGSG